MENLALFFAIFTVSMTGVFVAARLGKPWLYACVPVLLVIGNIGAAKLVLVSGFVTSLALPIYAAIFLATDTLSEKYGASEAYKAVQLGFAAQALLVALGMLMAAGTPFGDASMSEALDTIFGFIPRIVAGSFVAYVVSQHLDVWIFHRLRQATDGKHLFFRNTVSTTISQGVDSLIFIGIAFYGVLPGFWMFFLTTWFIKTLVAIADTPFVYLATRQSSPR